MKILPKIRKLSANAVDSTFRIIEAHLFLSDNPAMVWSLKVLEKTYNIINNRRQSLECKRLKLILQAKHKLKPGGLMRTKSQITTRTEVSIQNLSDRKWVIIPKGGYVMFLNIIYDQNFFLPTMQIIWDDRIVYLHS